MKDYTQDFEMAWKRFETNLRGKLLAKSKTQSLTLGLANIILKDASAAWLSMYDMCGKWLVEYSGEYPDKGAIITDVFKNDLKFTHEAKQQSASPYIKYAVPAAGALIGGGIAYALSAKLLVTIASAAVPAAALYPVASAIEKSSGGADKTTNDYIAQLDIYKTSIVSILQN